MENDDLMIDLDQDRARRADQRAVSATVIPIRVGGEVVAHVPSELPLAILAPLRQVDSEITLLIRTMIDVMNSDSEAQARWDATQLVVDLLTSNPRLPATLIDVVTDMGTRLLGADGLDALVACGLSREDMSFLIQRLMKFYGFSLGESRPSSISSSEETTDGGTTSVPTGSTTTTETPETSGETPPTETSSEPGAS